MDNDPNKTKDLTGIIDLQKLQAENPEPVDVNAPTDPFAVNEQTIEQVDSFESINQMEMVDHPENSPIAEDPFTITQEETLLNDPQPLENLKTYSEQTQGKTNLEIKVHYPFHLKINGSFGPFERDKLLLFITENPIGLSSSDLDLQITAGKVFLPRISEYAAVKLVQELRDSGLAFTLHPSDQEGNETASSASPLAFHYQNIQNSEKTSTLIEIPILTPDALSSMQKSFQEIDEVSSVQYVRTEMLEMENSPVIQEVIERMIESLKQKARLKGGNALLNLKQEITPLRLPSQYQISLKASVVKIKTPHDNLQSP